jgi:hypothetical protein
MGLRERAVERPTPDTCNWPLEHPEYRSWLTRSNIDQYHGLLRLTGHPGSGKSVLIKALADACSTPTDSPETHVATFYFDARATSDQKSELGLLKALLFQLLPTCAKPSNYFAGLFSQKVDQAGGDVRLEWYVADLRDALLKFCSVQRDTPIYIFVDAVDECEDIEGNGTNARSIATFLQKLADTAYEADSNLNICFSSRRYPAVSIRICAEIHIDSQNYADVEQYVGRELDQLGLESSTKSAIKRIVTSRASGVFLWARLVLSSITQSFDTGLNMDVSSVLHYLQEVPETLYKMFDRILEKLSQPERVKALRLFQWAVLAQRPLSANEWVHILAFVDEPKLQSMAKWSESTFGVYDVGQLGKHLLSMTGGLLEVSLQSTSQASDRSVSSAIASSMEPYNPDDPVVQFIHQSVSQYFLTGEGFKLLDHGAPPACFGTGHMYLATVCLRYLRLGETDPLATSMATWNEPRSHHGTSITEFVLSNPGSSSDLGSLPDSSSWESSPRNSAGPTNSATPASPAILENSVKPVSPAPSPTRPKHTVSKRETPPSGVLQEWLETGMLPVEPTPILESSPEHHYYTYSSQGDADFEGSFSFSSHESLESVSATHHMLPTGLIFQHYAAEMFEKHAVAANNNGADPSELLDMIQTGMADGGKGCWIKWRHLNDRIRSDTTPAYFAAAHNLHSWIDWYARSPSHRHMLYQRGGDLRHPLLAAICFGHDSIVGCLSDHFDAEIPVKRPWELSQYLAANKVKADTTLAQRQFSHGLVEYLLTLSASVRTTRSSVVSFALRFRRYLRKYGVDDGLFESMLIRIQRLGAPAASLPEREPGYENKVESFLDDLFLRAGC